MNRKYVTDLFCYCNANPADESAWKEFRFNCSFFISAPNGIVNHIYTAYNIAKMQRVFS